MAYKYLLGPHEHHNAPTVEKYLERHRAYIAKLQRKGARVEVHTDPTPLVARVDYGNWVVDCDCGAGNATHPGMGIACCFGCGAIHPNVDFPAEHAEIERVLTARPRPGLRAWHPGEPVDRLRAENRALNVPEERER